MAQLSDEVVERVARALAPYMHRKQRVTIEHAARAAIAAYEAKGDIPVDEG